MRYLFNTRNHVVDAALTATNAIPSNVITRTDDAPKQGGGDVSVSGDYTGATDTTIDIEIVSDTIDGTPRISQPVFVGVGNGAMSDVSADDTVDAQEFVVTLTDLGTETRTAYVPFQGVTLKARTPGDAGNAIVLDVDRSELVRIETNYSLQDDLRQGTNEYSGDHWNFGAVLLTPDGKIPTANPPPRLSFGDDPQVYVPYKFFRDGAYVYGFSPTPVRDCPQGAKVYAISGAYTITATDGVSTDTFEDVVTLYDALSKISGTSTLLTVDRAPVRDTVPGGQAVVDVSVWTRSYVTRIERDGSDVLQDAEFSVVADTDTPTERLIVSCINSALYGRETWKVMGAVSGRLQDAETGTLYEDGGYHFTIPSPGAGSSPASTADMDIQYVPSQANSDLPAVCFKKPRLGIAARPGTFTFVWTKKPSEECSCDDGDYSGAPNDDCLGTTPEGGDVSDAFVMTRIKRITGKVAEFSADNSEPPELNGGGPGSIARHNPRTFEYLQSSAGILIAALKKLAGGKLTWPAWSTSHLYTQDEIHEPTTPNGYRYAATTPGTSGSSEPTWPTTIDGTVTDGGVTWTCISKKPIPAFDDAYAFWLDDVDFFTTASELVDTVDIDAYNDRYRTLMADVLITAEITPDFDSASNSGDGCWRDQGGDYWWVYEGSGIPYMPLQNGVYNYSCKSSLDEQGRTVVNSTHEWGFGIQVGCPEKLIEGDAITVIIEGGSATSGGGGYQNGDQFTVSVVHSNSLQLGGGQTGDDTLTFSVIGSVSGGLDNYSLVTTSPTLYSDGGLSFAIDPGAIGFALGDSFRFSVEGGKFHWRQNGGTWSADIGIDETVTLVDGLVATFKGGNAPSWVAGDIFSFAAEATNSAEGLRSPGDARFAWTGSTVIEIQPDDTTVNALLIADHTIPSDATITLQASDDDFATHTDTAIAWARGTIWKRVELNSAAYRLVINRGGTINWLFLGESFQPTLPTNVPEIGTALARNRLPAPNRRRGIGVDVEHSALSWSSGAELLEELFTACELEGGRFGIALHDSLPDAGIVTTNGDTVERSDSKSAGFQPTNPGDLLVSVRLTLNPIT